MENEDDRLARIDNVLEELRQGDYILAPDFPFIHLADLRSPLTDQAREFLHLDEGGDPVAAIQSNVAGLVILSQTCDIVRSARVRPMIELAVLEAVSQEQMEDIERGRAWRTAVVPTLKERLLAANLDHVMTAEKGLFATFGAAAWQRGMRNESESRTFASAVARKYDRFAFPNDFVTAVKRIQDRIVDKYNKPESPEGHVYKAVREIRVLATPSWTDLKPELTFLFIIDTPDQNSEVARGLIGRLIDRFTPCGNFGEKPGFQLVTPLDITAQLYIDSVRLELDYLSRPRARAAEKKRLPQ